MLQPILSHTLVKNLTSAKISDYFAQTTVELRTIKNHLTSRIIAKGRFLDPLQRQSRLLLTPELEELSEISITDFHREKMFTLEMKL